MTTSPTPTRMFLPYFWGTLALCVGAHFLHFPLLYGAAVLLSALGLAAVGHAFPEADNPGAPIIPDISPATDTLPETDISVISAKADLTGVVRQAAIQSFIRQSRANTRDNRASARTARSGAVQALANFRMLCPDTDLSDSSALRALDVLSTDVGISQYAREAVNAAILDIAPEA